MNPHEVLAARAQQALSAQHDLPSPCNSVCRMGDDGRCEGCLRSLDEIVRWSQMNDEQKRAVWSELALRAAAETFLSFSVPR